MELRTSLISGREGTSPSTGKGETRTATKNGVVRAKWIKWMTKDRECSVKRNICYGLEEEDGLALDDQPTQEEVEQAARLANAHDFIMAMPQGYDSVSLLE
jgi:hypothetical protein